MLTKPNLTDTEISEFKQNGFVLVSQAFNNDDMARILTWTEELQDMPEQSGKHWVFHEKSRLDPNRDLNIYHLFIMDSPN